LVAYLFPSNVPLSVANHTSTGGPHVKTYKEAGIDIKRSSRGARLNTRYFLDCRSGIIEAKVFLSLPDIREQIQKLVPYSSSDSDDDFSLFHFEGKHVKFISSISVSEDYQVDRLLGYIHALSRLKS
jgi:hypothetical protein|tara:strand:- start:830 stop:1210 length:381 start_codon:yes stop_codon:yes gene_type:complete